MRRQLRRPRRSLTRVVDADRDVHGAPGADLEGRAANEYRKDGVPGMKVMNVVTPSGGWTVDGTTNSQPLDVATASVSTTGVVRAASVVGRQPLVLVSSVRRSSTSSQR